MRITRIPARAYFTAIGMFLLILDSKNALMGAKDGMRMCMESVIPSLFPMLLLSVYLNSRLSDINLSFLSPLSKFIGVPKGYECILLNSWVGGYPVGAQTISQSYKNNEISEETAMSLLAFCNNAGPSFIFGVTSQLFEKRSFVWILWFIQIISSYCTGLVLFAGKNKRMTVKQNSDSSLTIEQSLKRTIGILSNICGWVILFRIVICISEHWFLWLFPEWIKVIFTGALEMTNGCVKLYSIESEAIRFLICNIFLSMGGLCVLMQTKSVISPLSIKTYIIGKIIQTVIAFIIGYVISVFILRLEVQINPFVMVILTITIIAISFMQKTVAKSKRMLYTIQKG